VWVEREHVGAAAEVIQGVLDVAAGNRADTAQVLGQDQVRIHCGQRAFVQGIKILARGHPAANVGVDLGRSHR